jgi:hypothetical protein
MGLIPTFALPLAGEELRCSVARTRHATKGCEIVLSVNLRKFGIQG